MADPDPPGEFLPNKRSWLDQGAIREDAAWEAHQLRQVSRQIYRAGERYRIAETGELERIQPYAMAWIREVQARFEAADFRHVGDFEDVVINQVNRSFPRSFKRALSRVLLDRQHSVTTATLTTMRTAGLGNVVWLLRLAPRTGKLIDVETELSDGRFVVTSNLLGIDTSEPFPGVIRRQLPYSTGVHEMLAEHRRLLAGTLAEAPGVSPRPVRSLAEAIGMQQRLADLKGRHREAVGHLTPGEVRRSTGGKVDRSVQLLMEEAAQGAPEAPPPKPPSVLLSILTAFGVLVATMMAAVILLPILIPYRLVRGLWWRLRGRRPATARKNVLICGDCAQEHGGSGEFDEFDDDQDSEDESGPTSGEGT